MIINKNITLNSNLPRVKLFFRLLTFEILALSFFAAVETVSEFLLAPNVSALCVDFFGCFIRERPAPAVKMVLSRSSRCCGPTNGLYHLSKRVTH